MDLSERPADGTHRHPWELARFRFFADLVHEHGNLRRGGQLLDAGAGDGWFTRTLLGELSTSVTADCWDIYYTDDDLAALPGGDRLRFVRDRPNGRYDVILLLDVLEHVEDDGQLLRTLVEENLATDGTIIISVPAWKSLFSRHDVALRHYRRYTPWEGRRLVHRCGLHVAEEGGLFHSLLPVRVLGRLVEALTPQATSEPEAHSLVWSHGEAVTAPVLAALGADNRLSRILARRGRQLPGLSWWAVTKRSAF